jgi:regulator of sirC expression with transglutaminase-like and TPR domain
VHDYYAPENSFLNHVLNTQSGIPISLSVVYLEVGWRLDLPVWGIGMPRHFIVGYGQTDDPVYVDVFNRGMILSVDDCLEIADVPQTRRDVFQQQYLRPVSKKAILYRMLLNLKQIYFNAKAWESAYNVVDFLTLVNPKQASEFKDLGLLALRQNRLQDALFSLNRYLYMAPRQEDTDWIKDRVKLIEERLSQLN